MLAAKNRQIKREEKKIFETNLI